MGNCLNHGFSLIKRITRIIRLLLSKIELGSSAIMVSNTTYAAPAGHDSEMESLWSYKGDHNLTDHVVRESIANGIGSLEKTQLPAAWSIEKDLYLTLQKW